MDEQNHSGKTASDAGDSPKFGRLLIVLFLAVLAVAAITFASEAYYSR